MSDCCPIEIETVPKNTYIKPYTDWLGKERFYVAHGPTHPDGGYCDRLGGFFIIADSLFSATCIANAEARRKGGSVVVCDPLYN